MASQTHPLGCALHRQALEKGHLLIHGPLPCKASAIPLPTLISSDATTIIKTVMSGYFLHTAALKLMFSSSRDTFISSPLVAFSSSSYLERENSSGRDCFAGTEQAPAQSPTRIPTSKKAIMSPVMSPVLLPVPGCITSGETQPHLAPFPTCEVI